MAVFIQIKEIFLLSGKKPIVPSLKKNKYDSIDLTLIIDEYTYLRFVCGLENLVSGDLSISAAGKNIEVKCDAIFKIDLKPQYKEDFLSGNGKWEFSNIQKGIHGYDALEQEVNVKGLKIEKYKKKKRDVGVIELTRVIMKNVKTGLKKTDFK